MKIEEANRIIATFMGNKYENGKEIKNINGENYLRICKYNKSLDALVLVLEKIGKDFDCYLCRDRNGEG